MNGRRPAHERFVCDLDVELDTGRSRIPARLRDVIDGGMCCTIANPIAAGSNVTSYLRLVLEWGMSEPIAVFGQVVWLTPTEGHYQIGVAFSAPTPDVRQRIDVLLKVLTGQISLPKPVAG